MRSSAVLSAATATAAAAFCVLPTACGFSTAPARNVSHRRANIIRSDHRHVPLLNAASTEDESTRSVPAAAAATSPSVVERRDVVLRLPLLMTLASLTSSSSPAHAVVEKPAKVFKVGAVLTEEEAINRLRDAKQSVTYLLDHYDEVCDGGGDNVRRYLGTVGTTSGLYGISKAMKALVDRADDIVEYTELTNEIEANVQQADGSSYMAIFVTTSTSQDRPEKYFGEALVEIKRLAKNIDALAAMVGVDLQS